LSAKVKVWPAETVAVGATFGAVGIGDAVPGEALGGGVGLVWMMVTAEVGEATVDASGGQVTEIGMVGVVRDGGGAATVGAADAMTSVAGDTGNAEDGRPAPTKTCPGQAVVADAGVVLEVVPVVGVAHPTAAAASSSIGATMEPAGYRTCFGRAPCTHGCVELCSIAIRRTLTSGHRAVFEASNLSCFRPGSGTALKVAQ
jgi:hypothetical protein